MSDRPQRLEALSRLEQMAKDHQGTWDLSPNDQIAIRLVLDDLAEAESALSAARRRIELLEKTQASGRPHEPQSTVAAAPNGLTGSRGEKT